MSIPLIDTHTHPHMEGYGLSEETFFKESGVANVEEMICVGTSAADSERAIAFARKHDGCYVSVGLHPHDANQLESEQERLADLTTDSRVVAIGECGLDYYYENSPVAAQKAAFSWQLELAIRNHLPLILHVRDSKESNRADAFEDVFDILDRSSRSGAVIPGVVHSFTADRKTMEQCVERGLYIGLNGIMTFTKDERQLEAARTVPLERLVLETDAPFLTPVPYRGTINHSGHVRTVAEFISQLRGEPLERIAAITTANARELFRL